MTELNTIMSEIRTMFWVIWVSGWLLGIATGYWIWHTLGRV